MNLPKLFEDRMKSLLGEEFKEYLECYNKPHYGGIRINTLKISPQEFERLCPFSIKKIPWIPNGYYYDTNEQPARHPYYFGGLYYIQEPSAMTPASLLPVKPGDRVLDLCAAPGGKSTELGAKLKGEGLLVTNDISNSRAKALLKNIELFGIKNALVLSEAPNKLSEHFPEYFDKILVDAPCSGEGMFRKSPSIMKNWEQYGVDYYNKLQKEIILFAAKMLKPGGMMLYSTCTFSPEENEGTISYLLKECPDMHVIEALPDEKEQEMLGVSYEGFERGKPEWVNGQEELKYCLRLWPHKINGEGHFIALLRKDEKADNSYSNYQISDKNSANNKNKIALSDEAKDFLVRLKPFSNLNELIKQNRILIQKERVYLVPEGFKENPQLRTLRQGLYLGDMKKNRFEPSQALAMTLKSDEYDLIINLSSDNDDVIRYLKCETLNIEGEYKNGLQLICVDGYPLGWGKLSNGILKNNYLSGWRWM